MLIQEVMFLFRCLVNSRHPHKQVVETSFRFDLNWTKFFGSFAKWVLYVTSSFCEFFSKPSMKVYKEELDHLRVVRYLIFYLLFLCYYFLSIIICILGFIFSLSWIKYPVCILYTRDINLISSFSLISIWYLEPKVVGQFFCCHCNCRCY